MGFDQISHTKRFKTNVKLVTKYPKTMTFPNMSINKAFKDQKLVSKIDLIKLAVLIVWIFFG